MWTSSDDSIVSIDSKTGEMTALKNGTVIITVSLIDDSSIFDTCTINVIESKIASLSNVKFNLLLEESYNLSVIFNSNYSGDMSIIWSSDNQDIVSVDSNGLITGHAIGSTKIYAQLSNGDYLTCDVNVTEDIVPIEKIKFNTSEIHIDLNSELLLDYTISPIDASSRDLVFESSNNNVVSVDKNGYIKALGYGKAEVKVIYVGKKIKFPGS